MLPLLVSPCRVLPPYPLFFVSDRVARLGIPPSICIKFLQDMGEELCKGRPGGAAFGK